MCSINYFKLAYHNWDTARVLYDSAMNDELFISDISYNLQQCVEKTLKAFLEIKGVTVPNTHRITKLIKMSKDNGSEVVITDWIIQNKEMLENWEATSRYELEFYTEIQEVKEALDEIKDFLNLNGLTYKKDIELTEEMEEKLRKLLPKNLEIKDDFELNCYYHVFKKQIS